MKYKEAIGVLEKSMEDLKKNGSLSEEGVAAMEKFVDGVLTRSVLFVAGCLYEGPSGLGRIMTVNKYLELQAAQAIKEMTQKADDTGDGETIN